jgi:hypothetical protein
MDYYQVTILKRAKMELLTRLEDLQAQLDKSWPGTLEKTLREFPHGDEDFYIYTFTKWDYHQIPPQFNITHCPLKMCPESWFLPGTTMRRISPKEGWVKILWTLPEEHAFDLFKSGKIFGDPVVHESIDKYKSLKKKRKKKEEGYKRV